MYVQMVGPSSGCTLGNSKANLLHRRWQRLLECVRWVVPLHVTARFPDSHDAQFKAPRCYRRYTQRGLEDASPRLYRALVKSVAFSPLAHRDPAPTNLTFTQALLHCFKRARNVCPAPWGTGFLSLACAPSSLDLVRVLFTHVMLSSRLIVHPGIEADDAQGTDTL
jgi:hypothetical protein